MALFDITLFLLLQEGSGGQEVPDMATIGNIMTVARNQFFIDRVRFAAVLAANNVMAEVNTTPSHAQRVAYARVILAGAIDFFSLAIGVLGNATIQAEVNPATTPDFAVPDADIQFAVNSLFNSYAGIST